MKLTLLVGIAALLPVVAGGNLRQVRKKRELLNLRREEWHSGGYHRQLANLCDRITEQDECDDSFPCRWQSPPSLPQGGTGQCILDTPVKKGNRSSGPAACEARCKDECSSSSDPDCKKNCIKDCKSLCPLPRYDGECGPFEGDRQNNPDGWCDSYYIGTEYRCEYNKRTNYCCIDPDSW